MGGWDDDHDVPPSNDSSSPIIPTVVDDLDTSDIDLVKNLMLRLSANAEAGQPSTPLRPHTLHPPRATCLYKPYLFHFARARQFCSLGPIEGSIFSVLAPSELLERSRQTFKEKRLRINVRGRWHAIQARRNVLRATRASMILQWLVPMLTRCPEVARTFDSVMAAGHHNFTSSKMMYNVALQYVLDYRAKWISSNRQPAAQPSKNEICVCQLKRNRCMAKVHLMNESSEAFLAFMKGEGSQPYGWHLHRDSRGRKLYVNNLYCLTTRIEPPPGISGDYCPRDLKERAAHRRRNRRRRKRTLYRTHNGIPLRPQPPLSESHLGPETSVTEAPTPEHTGRNGSNKAYPLLHRNREMAQSTVPGLEQHVLRVVQEESRKPQLNGKEELLSKVFPCPERPMSPQEHHASQFKDLKTPTKILPVRENSHRALLNTEWANLPIATKHWYWNRWYKRSQEYLLRLWSWKLAVDVVMDTKYITREEMDNFQRCFNKTAEMRAAMPYLALHCSAERSFSLVADILQVRDKEADPTSQLPAEMPVNSIADVLQTIDAAIDFINQSQEPIREPSFISTTEEPLPSPNNAKNQDGKESLPSPITTSTSTNASSLGLPVSKFLPYDATAIGDLTSTFPNISFCDLPIKIPSNREHLDDSPPGWEGVFRSMYSSVRQSVLATEQTLTLTRLQ